jgi:Reverse transcriptase (RNA-dependent DNA polymerase)
MVNNVLLVTLSSKASPLNKARILFSNLAFKCLTILDSLLAYSTFNNEGLFKYLHGYKNIHVLFVFAVKHDLHHKARLVGDGNLTDPNTTDMKYSNFVSLRRMYIAINAGENNGLFLMVGVISSAYLEVFTLEKVCCIASPEFGTLAGHIFTMVHALHGLRTSFARWHDRFPDVMHLLGFFRCKADPDVWMHDCITPYDYVIVYVDDIMFIGKEPHMFFDSLIDEHGFKLKGIGTPKYQLDGDSFIDSDGTLA